MKNIPLESILELANSNLGITQDLEKLVVLSRLNEGIPSSIWSASEAYDGAYKDITKKINEWLCSRDYILAPSFAGGVVGVLLRGFDNVVSAVVNYSLVNKNLTFRIYGEMNEVEAAKDWVNANFQSEGVTIKTATSIDVAGKIKFDTRYLPLSKIQYARQSFYPWLSISLDEYFDAFFESKETVLVMFGPPGTGKSTFLRTLIAKKCAVAYLAYNKTVVESPELLTRFYGGNADLLGYEDIDKFLKKREDGNELMSTILNVADGVIQHENKKIVFATNLSSIDSIDPALLRMGRCFDILHFRNLTQDEAQAVLVDIGKPARDLSTKNDWSLTEILTEAVPAQQTINRFGKKIGFTR